jgi:hypothetical protein
VFVKYYDLSVETLLEEINSMGSKSKKLRVDKVDVEKVYDRFFLDPSFKILVIYICGYMEARNIKWFRGACICVKSSVLGSSKFDSHLL